MQWPTLSLPAITLQWFYIAHVNSNVTETPWDSELFVIRTIKYILLASVAHTLFIYSTISLNKWTSNNNRHINNNYNIIIQPSTPYPPASRRAVPPQSPAPSCRWTTSSGCATPGSPPPGRTKPRSSRGTPELCSRTDRSGTGTGSASAPKYPLGWRPEPTTSAC